MKRRINLDNKAIDDPFYNKIPMETITLVARIKELEMRIEQLLADLSKQQSELVNLRTFIGFNE